MALHARALVWVGVDEDGLPGALWPIVEGWIVDTYGSNVFQIGGYVVDADGSGRRVKVPADQVIDFHGWNPISPRVGSSSVHALKTILAEQIHAQTFRDQLWRNGGRVGTYLTRPTGAPESGNEGRARFQRTWQTAHAGDGRRLAACHCSKTAWS
ncbi:phage portal protein [Gordonia alkanivorans]|uniref:phage portal protein n=1 Tax=Gordonia alkanivorans TaxID=84096 RepID=UPI0013E2D046|nr:phage portal protein [Gordonia alkanivorans]